jgi:carbonic anhydrase/acetyltransferase-like protein (isoleucine patch superfamily)
MAIYSLDGKQPQLPDGFYYVAECAQVIGNVILQEGVGIWFGAVLRGDNEPITVGTGSNIQENCVLHTDMGYPLVIGQGCTIGNNSLVGMGATVLNGAQIGENCLIGAGALVTEGKVIPDNSLVMGSPAKVVKQLDGSAEAMLKLSAEHYVENARRFSQGLKRID